MNKKTFTALTCLISAIVFIIVAILFSDIINQKSETPKDNDLPVQTNPQTETENQNKAPETDVPENTDTENTDTPEDVKTEEKQPENTEPEKQPEPEKEPEKSPEPEKEPEKQPEPEKEPEKQPEPPKENITVSAGENYKSFSLLEGKSAKEAYDYLNEFLNSKYSILVNKNNKVSSDYAPQNLRTPSGSDYKLESTAATALEQMLSGARSAGYYDLVFYSGYRTYASQKNKYETRTQKYLNQGYSQADAEAKAGEYIAPPGSSEHHTGLAADVCSSSIVNKYGYLSDAFDQTKEWRWLSENCANYGFILRYRKDAESITGFLYEPWHFRYIGKDHAIACTKLGMTYEEYYSMLVKYREQAKADAGV